LCYWPDDPFVDAVELETFVSKPATDNSSNTDSFFSVTPKSAWDIEMSADKSTVAVFDGFPATNAQPRTRMLDKAVKDITIQNRIEQAYEQAFNHIISNVAR